MSDQMADKAASEAFTKEHRFRPNPNLGHVFGDQERWCWAAIPGERIGFHRCCNSPKVTLADGSKWCGVHSPAAVKRRADQQAARDAQRQATQAERDRRWRAEQARKNAGAAALDALRQIAAGHNDPRSLAAEILALLPD